MIDVVEPAGQREPAVSRKSSVRIIVNGESFGEVNTYRRLSTLESASISEKKT